MFFLKYSSVHRLQLLSTKFHEQIVSRNLTLPVGTPGAGAGKGGGAGGSVRESGGALGKYGAAQEEAYFYDKQKEKLEKLKKQLENESEAEKKKQDP